MAGGDENDIAHLLATETDRTKIIQALNDRLRCQSLGGQMAITRGVLSLGGQAVAQIVSAMRAYDAFTQGDDPYGEHDFGSIDRNGVKVFWKIDYYDVRMQFGSPDPADPNVTTRLLTILLAEEY